jgi:hypothetical protein
MRTFGLRCTYKMTGRALSAPELRVAAISCRAHAAETVAGTFRCRYDRPQAAHPGGGKIVATPLAVYPVRSYADDAYGIYTTLA